MPAFRALKDVRVAVVVDPLDASLQAARAAFPGVATESDHSGLVGGHLDGLIVASPPSTHLALWNLAAREGIPVFLEKPFALRGELEQAATGERERRLLMLDLNRRFWPPYRSIREAVRAGRLGDLERIEIWLHVDVTPWCSVTSHRLAPGEGGVLYDLGSQAIDLARWLSGSEPREVSAWRESHHRDHDHLLVQLKFQEGFQADCHLAYSKHAAERVVVRGRRGEVRLGNPNMTVQFTSCGKTGRLPWGHVHDIVLLSYRGLRRSRSMMRYSVAAALAAFTRSIARGLPFSPGFEDAVANMKCLDAAALALERGDSISLAGVSAPSNDHG